MGSTGRGCLNASSKWDGNFMMNAATVRTGASRNAVSISEARDTIKSARRPNVWTNRFQNELPMS